MEFQSEINSLVEKLIKSGMTPESISWLFNSCLTKKCDIIYRLGRELHTSRNVSPSDYPDGDCEHDPSITMDQLDKDLDEYRSHTKDCRCYLSENDCPICCESYPEYMIDCCNQWYHQKCLRKWFCINDNEKCPTCRTLLMFNEDGKITKKITLEENQSRNNNSSRVIRDFNTGNLILGAPRNHSILQVNQHTENQRFSPTRVAPLPPIPVNPSRTAPPAPDSLVERLNLIEMMDGYYHDTDHGFIIEKNEDGTLTALGYASHRHNRRYPLTEEQKFEACSLELRVLGGDGRCEYYTHAIPPHIMSGYRCLGLTNNSNNIGTERFCNDCIKKHTVRRILGLV